MIAAVFCPACGGREPAESPEVTVKSAETAKTAERKAAPATLDEAIALANAEGKNVLVEYTSRTCPYCRQMDSQTLANASVKSALSEKVVYFRTVKESNPTEFTDRFGSQPTPSYAVVSASGDVLHGPVSGVISASAFLSYVSWAEKGAGSAPALAPGGA
jgi:thiol:disulfide interchange protein